mgnify:CR=1 FL=1
MAGTLYLCATPIGNLGDMTPRVIETLEQVDLIAAEDTRNSIKLLNYFNIHTSMTSYHEYNKVEKAQYLIDLMNQGKDIALITDAGTPAISDPGEVLVKMCHEAGITVTSLPGPAACITALTLSGLSTRRFCFEGFFGLVCHKPFLLGGKPLLSQRLIVEFEDILLETRQYLRLVVVELLFKVGESP